jgi:hypothetical protein
MTLRIGSAKTFMSPSAVSIEAVVLTGTGARLLAPPPQTLEIPGGTLLTPAPGPLEISGL